MERLIKKCRFFCRIFLDASVRGTGTSIFSSFFIPETLVSVGAEGGEGDNWQLRLREIQWS